jgi:hypothetical protein
MDTYQIDRKIREWMFREVGTKIPGRYLFDAYNAAIGILERLQHLDG